MSGIRIDNLPATVLPALEHEIPSIKDGITVKLSVSQIKDLVTGPVQSQVDTLEAEHDVLDTLVNGPISTLIVEAGPTGSVNYFTTYTSPVGWLKANGAAVSRTTYADLFAVIDVTYGVGDGSTTFNLPDLRGEFIRGFDDGRGVDSGRGIGTAQVASRIAWVNGVGAALEGNANAVKPSWSSGGQVNLNGEDEQTGPSTTVTSFPGTTTSASATVQSIASRPRNVALLACIKY